MAFKPNVDDILNIKGVAYRVTEHPASSGSPLVVQGRQSTVYQLAASDEADKENLYALKVFEPRYRTPGLVGLNDRFRAMSGMPGLRVCDRQVLSISQDEELLRQYPDLNYAVLMPWIPGPTWMEVMLEVVKLTPKDSLKLARALAGVLVKMEESCMAHCDLTGGNILIPAFAVNGDASQSFLELVDVEQLYLPSLPQPSELAPPLPGYAYRKMKPLWRAEADRMAGAILLSEMLGWCDEKVRGLAWGEHYFDPKEIQQPDSERYQALRKALREHWGKLAATLLKQAWRSESLMDCPTFGEWLSILPKDGMGAAEAEPVDEAEDELELQPGKKENGAAIHALISLASQLERDGNIPGALAACRQAKGLYTTDEDLEDELDRTIGRLQTKMEETSAADSGVAMGAIAAGPEHIAPAPDVVDAAAEDAIAEEPSFPSPVSELKEEVMAPPTLEEPEPLQELAQQPTGEPAIEESLIAPDVSREMVEAPPVEEPAPVSVAPVAPKPAPPVIEPEEPVSPESGRGCGGGCFSWIILLILAIVAGVAIYYFVFMQHNQQVVDVISRIIGQQPTVTVVPAMPQETAPKPEGTPSEAGIPTWEAGAAPGESISTVEAGGSSLRGAVLTAEAGGLSPAEIRLTRQAGGPSPRGGMPTTEAGGIVPTGRPRSGESPESLPAGRVTAEPAVAASATPPPQRPASTPTTSAMQQQGPPGAPKLGQTWTRPTDGVVVAAVPGGQFQMGATASQIQDVLQLCREYSGICTEEWFESEQPAHDVTLGAFWIDRTEITNAKFVAFLNEQGMSSQEILTWIGLDSIDAQIEQTGDQYQPRSGYEAYPAAMVSWEGAQAYCQWAGARLPTEAEWEYAARGPESQVFPWGNKFEDANLNYKSSSDGYAQTAPAGSFLNGASWAGALDMSGNVAEWTADWFETYTAGSQSDPKGPATGQYRVNRGGSFLSEPFEARGASRSAGNPTDTNRAIGFRCAITS